MDKYIEAEKTVDTFRLWFERIGFRPSFEDVQAIIPQVPAADVAPVRHGRWVECPIADGIDQCSQCTFMVPEQNHYPYCPNCGSKMDLEG